MRRFGRWMKGLVCHLMASVRKRKGGCHACLWACVWAISHCRMLCCFQSLASVAPHTDSYRNRNRKCFHFTQRPFKITVRFAAQREVGVEREREKRAGKVMRGDVRGYLDQCISIISQSCLVGYSLRKRNYLSFWNANEGSRCLMIAQFC